MNLLYAGDRLQGRACEVFCATGLQLRESCAVFDTPMGMMPVVPK